MEKTNSISVQEQKQLKSLICPSCGSENPSEAIFCCECGSKIVNADESIVENDFPKSVERQFIQQPRNEENADSKLSSVDSLKNKVMSATRIARDTANQTIQNSKKIQTQDKSLGRLSNEKAGAGEILINIFGAMVVLMIAFRFVSSIFESPKINYSQQSSIAQTQTQQQAQTQSQTKKQTQATANQSQNQPQTQAQPKTNQPQAQSGPLKPPATQQAGAQPISSGAVVGAYHSSADQEGSYVHSAKLAIDGNTGSCWSEGVRGLGIGENIEIHFNGNYKVSGMNIWIGHQKSQDLFYQNARPTALRVEGSDGASEIYNLEDKFGSQRVTFKTPITANKVKLIVERVAPGNKYEDTCISEVEFF